MKFKQEDVREDTFIEGAARTAMRLTHIPTGIVVVGHDRSPQHNRERLMKELEAKVARFGQPLSWDDVKVDKTRCILPTFRLVHIPTGLAVARKAQSVKGDHTELKELLFKELEEKLTAYYRAKTESTT